MKLLSPDFRDGGKHSTTLCEGKDVSPTLTIDGVPKETRSLVLIVDDPDAPGGNFTHWLMWNIMPNLTEIVGNKPPAQAVQGVNDLGKSKYSGPCPPHGVHRYYFRLYALDTVEHSLSVLQGISGVGRARLRLAFLLGKLKALSGD